MKRFIVKFRGYKMDCISLFPTIVITSGLTLAWGKWCLEIEVERLAENAHIVRA